MNSTRTLRSGMTLRQLEKLSLGEAKFNEIHGGEFVPSTVKSIIGRRFGRLVVKHYAGEDKRGQPLWCCICECGNAVKIASANLIGSKRHEGTKSCGCIRADLDNSATGRRFWDNLNPESRANRIKKMRDGMRGKCRPISYSMDSHRAAELLGVSVERIEILAADGTIGSTRRRGALFVSSHDISSMLNIQLRAKRRCAISDEMLFGGGDL